MNTSWNFTQSESARKGSWASRLAFKRPPVLSSAEREKKKGEGLIICEHDNDYLKSHKLDFWENIIPGDLLGCSFYCFSANLPPWEIRKRCSFSPCVHPQLADREQLSMCSKFKRITRTKKKTLKASGFISRTGENSLSRGVYSGRPQTPALMFADVAVVFIPKQKQAADPPGYGWCWPGKYFGDTWSGGRSC